MAVIKWYEETKGEGGRREEREEREEKTHCYLQVQASDQQE